LIIGLERNKGIVANENALLAVSAFEGLGPLHGELMVAAVGTCASHADESVEGTAEKVRDAEDEQEGRENPSDDRNEQTEECEDHEDETCDDTVLKTSEESERGR
jgi:hypothetical protein